MPKIAAGTTCTATVVARRDRPGRFLVIVRPQGGAAFKRSFTSKRSAEQYAQEFNRLGQRGEDIAAKRRAAAERIATIPDGGWPKLRDALPGFITRMASLGVWRGSTPVKYRRRLAHDVYEFELPAGFGAFSARRVGDLPVDTLTPRMLGVVLEAATRSGRSMAVREQIRCPLRRYYAWLIKHEGFAGPNPAAELKDYMGHQETRRERITKPYAAFTRAEGRTLYAICQAHRPRHTARILVMLKAGLRYGEAAALEKGDVLWSKSAIYVQRAWNEATQRVEDLKNYVKRYAPMDNELAEVLRTHLETIELEASVNDWTPGQRALLLPGRSGTIVRESTFLQHVWRPLLEDAQLAYRKPHALRHTFATWALEGDAERGVPAENILKVRDWLGHASVEETERYAHVNSLGATATLNAMRLFPAALAAVAVAKRPLAAPVAQRGG